MPWQAVVICGVFFVYCVAPIVLKRMVGLPSRTRRLTFQFLFCFILSAILLLVTRTPLTLGHTMLLVAGLGIANSFGAYAQWRAMDISLSGTSLFTQADDLIAISLGFIILGEGSLVKPVLLLGVALCLGGALVFTVMHNRDKTQGGYPLKIFGWIAIYSVIWGVVGFAQRYFALKGLTVFQFIFAWYGGSTIGSLLVAKLMGKAEAGKPLDLKAYGSVAILSSVVILSMMLAYWAKIKAPIAVVQPIYQVGEMILPTIIGLWWFKEGKQLDLKGKLIFAAGIAGTLIIALSY